MSKNDKIIEILNDINVYYNNKTIQQEFLSTLEKAIQNNYISIIKETFKAGETIYQKNIICNGWYQKKYDMHPNKCHDYICYKTPMYYALWFNTYYYSNIFSSIIEILNDSPILWFNTNNVTDLRENKIKNLSYSLKDLYEFIINIECSCICKDQFAPFYDQKYMNFEKVNKFMISKFGEILRQLENIYGFGVYTKEDTWILSCHKNIITKQYVYNHDNTDNSSCQNIRDKLEFIRQNWNKYKTNCEIVKIMFNQQAYEYYKHYLKTKIFRLSNIIDNISTNPYIDINYSLHGNNIFGLTIMEQNRPELTNKLILLGAKIPQQLSFNDIMKKCDITNVKEIIKNYKEEYFGNIRETVNILIGYENMLSCDKIEIIEILNKREILENIDDVVQIFLEHDLSYNFIEKIYENKNIMNRVSSYDIYLCIKYIKQQELEMIFKYNADLVNQLYNKKYPLFHYFSELTENIPNALDLLKILLLNKADVNIQNENNETPLLIGIKNKFIKSFEMMLKFGGNPFICDKIGLNSFHYAIKNNCIGIIKNLIKYEREIDENKEKIINTTTKDHVSPLMLAMESSNAIEITKLLLFEHNIGYNFKTQNRDNLLFYLLDLKINQNYKNNLFSLYLKKNIDLLIPSKKTMKPLVVEAVEKNYYHIVIMIMNKLLQLEEIKVQGFDSIKDIKILLQNNKSQMIIVKNDNVPNFYSLVMVYLKSQENINVSISDISSNNEIIINGLTILVICIFFIFMAKNYLNKTKINFGKYKRQYILDNWPLFKIKPINHKIGKKISKKNHYVKRKIYERSESSSYESSEESYSSSEMYCSSSE